jgi:hypothetical protein
VKESKTGKRKLLLDTGADICLIKISALLETTQFDPRKKVKVKSLEGTTVETDDIVELCIHNGELEIPFEFQLVSKQVELV